MNKIFSFALMAILFPAIILAAPHRSEVACRDGNGKIKRSTTVKREFRRLHPCPATGETKGACPGYVIDHVVALKRGGPDHPENLQWQTVAEAKTKDKME